VAKLLLVVVVILLGAWLLFGRRRGSRPPEGDASRRPGDGPPAPLAMVACAHCGVHLPREDAVVGGSGAPYCSEAHRDAGPR
jgi:uncharacterized protein